MPPRRPSSPRSTTTRSVIADQRLRGNPAARGASAFDGDPTTAWQTPFDDAVGSTVRFDGGPSSLDNVTVSWLDDERHSVPTQLTLNAADGSVRILDLPAREPIDGLASATIDDRPRRRDEPLGDRQRDRRPDHAGRLLRTAAGPSRRLAEIELGAATPVARNADEELDASCRDDLVSLDGEPIPVRLVGTRGDALARSELRMESCDPIRLTSGTHRLDAASGTQTGFDIDRVILDSAVPSPVTAATAPAPTTTIDENARTAFELTVGPSAEPTWLVLQQSWNARVDGTLRRAGSGRARADQRLRQRVAAPSVDRRLVRSSSTGPRRER